VAEQKGISLLEEYALKSDASEHMIDEVQNILELMTHRDRTAFARRARILLGNLNRYAHGFDVSDCFSTALNDDRLLRLDRFCFLSVSCIVWNVTGTP